MNVRTQITINEDLQQRAQAKAEELGISFAEFARRALDAAVGKQKPKPDMSIFFDLGASAEPTDIARDKDKLIGEAVWEDYLRSTGKKPRRKRGSKSGSR